MQPILVLGAGKIGSLIACLLADSGDYQVELADLHGIGQADLTRESRCGTVRHSHLDAGDGQHLREFAERHRIRALISALPYHCNPIVADCARALNIHYLDLTEDVSVSNYIRTHARDANSAFAPQCGLAPGFISIAANHLIGHFDHVDTVKMRVGALPLHPSNALKYSLTWSTDGLINEYGNPCWALEEGDKVSLQPLEGYEIITLDGLKYEAFNTSGGLGTLADTYAGKIRRMNYKTVRYPGHCEKISFLMNDLRLNEDRDTLKRILESAIPKTVQDVVLIYVAVTGYKGEDLYEETYVQKIYPRTIAGRDWSAIQVSTASAACCVLDLILQQPEQYKGVVCQEQIPLQAFLDNRFGACYRSQPA